jgi:hypothetical protein
MVWIYEDPLTKKEKATYAILLKRLPDKKAAIQRTKILSLTGYILSNKFKSASHLSDSVFYDRAKRYHVFNKKDSTLLFKKLNQSGGRSGYPFINHVLSRLNNSLPSFISYPIDTLVWIGELPIRGIKALPVVGPIADVGLDALHGVVEVGVTATEDVAKDIAGPVGAAGATVVVAIPSAAAALLAIGQGDPGQALAHVVKVIPFVGGILSKVLNQVETNVDKLADHPDVAKYIPLVGDYHTKDDVVPEPEPAAEAAGGKRLSTMKHRYHKWPKTIRHKKSVTH